MVVAHSPAGYIIGKIYSKCLGLDQKAVKHVIASAIAGSLISDVDLFYQRFVDNMQVNHHLYPTHIPAYWAGVTAIFVLTSLVIKRVSHVAIAFLLGGISHLVLDTPMGGIMWKYPFDNTLIRFVDIPAVRNPYAMFDYHGIQVKGWVLNGFEHASFRYEVYIVAVAAIIFVGSKINSFFKRT